MSVWTMRGTLLSVALLSTTACAVSTATPPPPMRLARHPAAPVLAPPRCDAAQRLRAGFPTRLEMGLRSWLGASAATPNAQAQGLLEEDCADLQSATRAGSCSVLGIMRETGDGAERDVRMGSAFFELASDPSGFELGGCSLGSDARVHGIKASSTSCCRIARGCPKGCAEECGEALDQLRASTVHLLEQGCRGGRQAACYIVAEVLSTGEHIDGLGYLVEQDYDRTIGLLEQACEGGIGRACGDLGLQQQHHLDAPDLDGAERFYERGCELGAGPPCIRLAQLIDERAAEATTRANPNADPAAWWTTPFSPRVVTAYEQGCRFGMRAVCRDLATMFAEGDRVPKDPSQAEEFANLAKPLPQR